MKTSLVDLNDMLFRQLEALGNEDLTGAELEDEIERSKALSSVSSQIIQNASLLLKAHKLASDSVDADARLPKLLLGDGNGN